jgi:hypothetical protein
LLLIVDETRGSDACPPGFEDHLASSHALWLSRKHSPRVAQPKSMNQAERFYEMGLVFETRTLECHRASTVGIRLMATGSETVNQLVEAELIRAFAS